MANKLLANLRKKDKKGLFTRTQSMTMYRTGFLPFDYKNGYAVEVRNNKDELVETYINAGVAGGSFVTIIGKSGVAKTTFAIQVASEIVKPFDSGLVMHYDLEQALNYTRIKNVSRLSTSELDSKYVLKQERSYIEDIFDAIIDITEAKEENKEDFMYDTGFKNEFNEPVKAYVPTVIIIDSIPTLSVKDSKKTDEMEGSTYASRVAKAIAQFYKKLMPVIKEFNITVIAINHINAKIDINPMAKTQPQLMYLKADEAVPGGNAPIYYANNLFKFVKEGSLLTEDENGFDGFVVRNEILKSRTNKAGKYVKLVYNQLKGFDQLESSLIFMEENNLLDGRNPYKKFVGFDDVKFDSRKFAEEFKARPEVRETMMKVLVPYLEKSVDIVDEDDEDNNLDLYELYSKVCEV